MLQPNRVFCACSPRPNYAACEGVSAPELPGGQATTSALVALRALFRHANLDQQHYGSAEWNPLSEVINDGDRVLIKPNWVYHRNFSGRGLDCLVTDTSVIEAILRYVLKARPKSVVIGDAPIQGCDFDLLRTECRIDKTIQQFEVEAPTLTVTDLRRTILPGGKLENRSVENSRSLDQYVLFNLAELSELEAITHKNSQFRVTMYDPHALERTHAPGKHQYLIAREAIDANVVINVPKLKTHKKACITGALKNMVGINGHKEYLPHHRKGGSLNGGDCYPGRSLLKGFAEDILDATNGTARLGVRQALVQMYKFTTLVAKKRGEDFDLEGSWYGNDTVWRTCLDLQKILHYGRQDGTLSNCGQRTVLTITDAIICGEGNGPLSPTPVPLGMLTMATNVAAAEWIHARLMGFDPARIPLTRQAFSLRSHPLATFAPEDIVAEVDGTELAVDDLVAHYGRAFIPPDGWQGHCEFISPVSEELR